jgi:signal transduction histidine kinase
MKLKSRGDKKSATLRQKPGTERSWKLGQIKGPGGRKKELKERIRVLEKKLSEQNARIEVLKSNFLKNIYHEIRTPLNAIVGFTNLLSNNLKDAKELSHYNEQISNSSHDFLNILDDIIEASLIEADMVKIWETPTELALILDEVHTFFKVQKHIKDKDDVVFLMNIPEEFRKNRVLCDRYRINQVLIYLISNAFKFTRKGIVEVGCTLKDMKWMEFYVKDSGLGGLEDKEELIFSSFTKLDNTALSQKGLGLGLSISKNLVELMGGKIWYNPNKLGGTTFYFSLPHKPVKREQNDDATYKSKPTFRVPHAAV